MDPMDRPHPAPRPRRHRREKPGTPYSSSDECDDGQCENEALCRGRDRSGSRDLPTSNSLGLTPDESHISPIENLDNTINRLYSYLSGSEGDVETDHPLTPPQRQGGRTPDPLYHRHQRQRSCSPTSIPSSRSSSCSRTDSDPDHDPAMDTLGSCETGENVYSRINETGIPTLPLPPIPPPPLEDAQGPAVPPRRNVVKPTRLGSTQSPYSGGDISNRTQYTEVESDFEPHYLVQTSSGNVFYPPGPPAGSPPGSPQVPNFPRTVPRIPGVPPPPPSNPPPPSSARSHTPELLNNAQPQQRVGTTGDPNLLSGNDYGRTQSQYSHSNLASSSSTDRIKLQLKEMEENWASPNKYNSRYTNTSTQNINKQQNVTFNTSVNTNIPVLPTYPSIQNDFRDYSRFNNASYRMKKHFKTRCSWRCVALIFMFLTVALAACVAYFVAMKVGNLDWRLEEHLLLHGNHTGSHGNAQTTGITKGAMLTPSTPSVIIVQYPLGRSLSEDIPPHSFWRTQFYMPLSSFVKFNFTIPPGGIIGVYGRKNVQPSHTQYDFFHVIDGRQIHEKRKRAVDKKKPRQEPPRDTAFIHYMESGLWYVFLFNDDEESQTVQFIGTQYDQELVTECPNGCHGRGECINGQCRCFSGYTGWDCGQNVCPVVCMGNGIYAHGQCKCYPGWKGKECHIPEDECEVPTCNGNGKCISGRCVCSPGYAGIHCDEVTCLMPNCSGNGVCVGSKCLCYTGYQGTDCSLPALEGTTICSQECSGHGVYHRRLNQCLCEYGYSGDTCQNLEVCDLECVHGSCESQRCICEEGWTGALCDQVECDRRCSVHGYCNNGTCICKPGWNGRHCSLSGCPDACNNNGACQLFQDGWKCSCRDGWKGSSCNVAMEIECEDGIDDDSDGLVDCQDPDCCMSIICKDDVYCTTSPDPMDILLRKQPPSTTASFYDRMRFLVEDHSVQSYATLSSFNQSQVSVIRGEVISSDGSPLIGVRVSVVTQPLYGFTLTRELGLFDILVNGGGSVTLQFQRKPFVLRQTTVMVPWNQMVTMETVILTFKGEKLPEEEECVVAHDHYMMKPVVLSTWQHTQLGACPAKSTLIPESQVLQESLQIPGTGVYLVYHSSETPGYMSTIMIQLTPDSIPDDLSVVHLKVSVEGLTYAKVFEADPGLKYKFAWDRRNAYNQKVYGIVTAQVGVGYQYQECNRIYWETQSATMSGYDITSSEIGGWNLHIHHTYNFQEGILHKGDGTNIYLKEQPRKVITVLGNGKQRRLDCRGCDGTAENSKLMAPVALASGRDGSLYVGDFNHIRKLSANRQDITSILELDMGQVAYKYFMTVSPLDGKLYISDYQSNRILRVKTMGAVRDLRQNMEVIAGTGDKCVPGDRRKCGDDGPSAAAHLFYPKGIAINKDGIVFFADGANIRVIDRDYNIRTLIGSQGQPAHYEPPPCGRVLSVDEVKLQWPTALAINPLDDTLHILDNKMVMKVTKDGKVLVVAGRAQHCPLANPHINPLLTEDQAGPKMAVDVNLEEPQHITFAPNGYLYIVESDGKLINRVREVSTDGTISHYMGDKSKCSCKESDCKCYDPREVLATKVLLNAPTAITVTPDGVAHVSDMGNLRIHSVVATLPEPDSYGQYKVLYPQTQELYIFNRFGQHTATKNLISDQYVYNFTYNVNSYYGKLVRVTDSEENRLTIRRDYTTQAKEIMPPGGQKCKFIMDNMGQLHIFIAADNSTTKFTYLSNSGLLETKETSEGHTFLYEYDVNGRVASVVEPTGERTTLSTDVDPTGAIVRLSTDTKDKVALATNGNMLSVLHGKARTKVSYLHDGALVVEYPFNMAITMETSPHPLLSTEHQLQLKRKVILPDGLIHRLEWRYYLRREKGSVHHKILQRIGRRMRVGKAGASRHGGSRTRHDPDDSSDMHASSSAPEGSGAGYEGKALLVNGVNLLTMEYDRESHSETVLDQNQEEILTILYNNAGQPTNFVPDGPLHSVNITYNSRGQPIEWGRGELSVVNVYDVKTGYLTERKIGNKATYRYIYKSGTKPTDVILPSGKQYVLHYDDFGNLKEVVMPGLGKHHFHSLTTLKFRRIMYTPPLTTGRYVQDYNSAGKTIQVLYPSLNRRVVHTYNNYSKHEATYFDWSDLEYEYYEDEGVLYAKTLTNRVSFNFTCRMLYEPAAALVKYHTVSFNKTGFPLLEGKYHYAYDGNFRVSSMEASIGSHNFKPVNFTYNVASGRLDKMKDFVFQYPKMHQEVMKDANMEIVREYDNYDRLTDVWYKFNNYMVFTLEVKYDELNRLHQWRRKVGTSDLKAYEYVYDIDNNILEVILSGQTTWKYEHDANNNIIKLTHHEDTKTAKINIKNQLEMYDGVTYQFDQDGFMVHRDKEVFEYNSLGQLVRAFEVGKYDVHYFYDGEKRLVARKDILDGYVTQFFYGDIVKKDRITHIYDHSTQLATVLYYDNHGHLFSMEQDGRYFYIALDPMGSPVVIFNAVGGVVKQMTYDPLGWRLTDSAPDFQFIFGFQCGIVDHITKLIHMKGQVYDPKVGRWTSPDYEGMLADLNNIELAPGMMNLYQNRDFVSQKPLSDKLMTDIPSWLMALGYDMESLVPHVSFEGQIRPVQTEVDNRRLMPVTSAFECAYQRDMQNFIEMSTVPRSKVTTMNSAEKIVKSFSPFRYMFGDGVLVSTLAGRVQVDQLDSSNEILALLATTLLNNSNIVPIHMSIHGRDAHYFVKSTINEAVADVRDLSLRTEDNIGGINVSVHRFHETSEIMKYVDIRLHGNHTVMNLRYGTSPNQEVSRILHHAKERATESAWKLEKELLKDSQQTLHKWTQQQKNELLKKGIVSNMKALYIRDVRQHPELADDPRNIKFVPTNR